MSDVRERLWPAWWLGLVQLGLGTGFGLVFAPFGARVALVVGVGSALVLGGLLLASTPTIGVVGEDFVAGRARIPLRFLGEPEELDAAAMRHANGPGLDVRAYLCLRGWLPAGVRVPVTDPDDPTPYWLVSSRRPRALADAVRQARA